MTRILIGLAVVVMAVAALMPPAVGEEDPDNWNCNLKVYWGAFDGVPWDTGDYIGVQPGATDDYDLIDSKKPAEPLGNYVYAWFERPTWGQGRIMSDWRAPIAEGTTKNWFSSSITDTWNVKTNLDNGPSGYFDPTCDAFNELEYPIAADIYITWEFGVKEEPPYPTPPADYVFETIFRGGVNAKPAGTGSPGAATIPALNTVFDMKVTTEVVLPMWKEAFQPWKSDCSGLDSADTAKFLFRVINPISANLPPTCEIIYSPAEPTTADTIDFDSQATDADGVVASVGWDFGDGESGTGLTTTHTYAAAGTYTVTATPVDEQGADGTCTTDVTVTAVNLPPTCGFTFSPTTGECAEPVSFTDTSTDSDGTIVGWAWDFGDASTSTEQNPSHTFAVGTWSVCLTVTDNGGAGTECCSDVTVADTIAPEITCPEDMTATSPDGGPVPVSIGMASATDDCDDAPTVNGTRDDGQGLLDDYPVGTTTITWVACDVDANCSSCDQTVTVSVGNQPPDCCISGPTEVTAGIEACWDDCSTDPDGTIVSREWYIDNEAALPPDGTDPQLCHTFASAEAGPVFLYLCVTDDDGATACCRADFTVLACPSVTCAFSVQEMMGLSFQFNDESTTAAPQTIASWSWSFGDGATSTEQNPSHEYAAPGDYEVCLTVTNDCGESATCCQTVTACPYPVSCFTFDPAEPTTADVVQFTDCSTGGDSHTVASWSWTFGDANLSTDQNPTHQYTSPGTYAVCLTVTNDCGKGNILCQDVVVSGADEQAPTITCPGEGPYSVGAECTYPCPAATATDNVDPNPTVTQDPAAGTPLAPGDYTILVTACDASGNCATNVPCTISVVDDLAPELTCPDDVQVCTDSGTCVATGVVLGDATATDNCEVTSLDNDAPAEFPLGTTVVTWTACDAAGNCTPCTQNVVVNDCDAPSVTCPDDVVVGTDPGACVATGVALGDATATDNCEVASLTNDAPAEFPLGATLVTWTACDDAGNCATCEQTVTVEDDEAPVFDCVAEVTVTSCTAVPNDQLEPPMVTDNCGVASLTNDGPTQFEPGTTTPITWTACDEAGNCQTCDQAITVVCTVNEPPVCSFQAPGTTVECGDPVVFTDLSFDPDGDVVAWDWDFGDGGTSTAANPTHVYTATGDYTVNLTVTDDLGATAECPALTITVVDTTPPVINCPDDITVDTAPGECSAVVEWTCEASDTCSDATCSCDPASGSTFPIGVTPVTCTATDAAGNTASCAFTVTVNDAEPPTISCPANVTLESCDPISIDLEPATASDNCDPDPTVTATRSDGSALGDPYPVGTTTVTWTACDAAGNCASCEQTVTVTCPLTCEITYTPASPTTDDEITFDSGASEPGATVDWDFGDGTTATGDPATHQYLLPGTYTVTVTVCSSAGAAPNCVTCTAEVMVEKGVNLPPECAPPGAAAITYSPPAPRVGQEVSFTSNAYDPNPWGSIVSYEWDFGDGGMGSGNPATHTYAAVGTYTVCVTVTDDEGAVTQCCTDVTVTEVTCECNVAIYPLECVMPAAGWIGQCKKGQIAAVNLSSTESCLVEMIMSDNCGNIVYRSGAFTLGPGEKVRNRFEWCYLDCEKGKHCWTWEVWPVDCDDVNPMDNVYRHKVNVVPGERTGQEDSDN